MDTSTEFFRPVYVMTKPAGALCNLACEYCYYLENQRCTSIAQLPAVG